MSLLDNCTWICDLSCFQQILHYSSVSVLFSLSILTKFFHGEAPLQVYPSRFWSVDTKPPLSRGWDSAGLKDRYKSSCSHSKWEFSDRHQRCSNWKHWHWQIDQSVLHLAAKVQGGGMARALNKPWFSGTVFLRGQEVIIPIEDPMDQVSSGHRISYKTM